MVLNIANNFHKYNEFSLGSKYKTFIRFHYGLFECRNINLENTKKTKKTTTNKQRKKKIE